MKKEKEKPKPPRFTEKLSQGMLFGMLTVLVDRETGVNYIVVGESSPTYITPLIGADGKIIVDKIEEQ